MRLARARALVVLLGALASPLAVHAGEILDSGSYQVSLRGRVLGAETFSFQATGDSILVFSRVFQTLPSRSGVDTLEKQTTVVLAALDYDLRDYQSHQTLRGHTLDRGLVMQGDTAFTSYTQLNQRGEGLRLTRPPGRMFVQDPQVFVLYDLICRSLHGKEFETRPISMFALGNPDSLQEAMATDLGTETIRWGGAAVPARKIGISDSQMEFFVWLSREGQMLRLSQPEFGLLVERAPPAVKPSAKTPRRAG